MRHTIFHKNFFYYRNIGVVFDYGQVGRTMNAFLLGHQQKVTLNIHLILTQT